MKHLPSTTSVTADLHDQEYTFPQQIATTDTRPDITAWDERTITLIELTVPYEMCTESAVERKRHRYHGLLEDCRANGYTANLLTVEVGSRGFLHCRSFDSLYRFVPSRICEQEALEEEIIRICIQESYRVWCKRNWREAESQS